MTLLKNESKRKLFLLIPLRLVLDGVAGVRFLTEGKFKEIWAIVRAHFYIYPRFFHIMKQRKYYKKIIQKHSIGEPTTTGFLKKSIVWEYFVKGKKTFTDIV